MSDRKERGKKRGRSKGEWMRWEKKGIKLWSAIDKLEEDGSGMPKLLIQGHSRKALHSHEISTPITLGPSGPHTTVT